MEEGRCSLSGFLPLPLILSLSSPNPAFALRPFDFTQGRPCSGQALRDLSMVEKKASDLAGLEEALQDPVQAAQRLANDFLGLAPTLAHPTGLEEPTPEKLIKDLEGTVAAYDLAMEEDPRLAAGFKVDHLDVVDRIEEIAEVKPSGKAILTVLPRARLMHPLKREDRETLLRLLKEPDLRSTELGDVYDDNWPQGNQQVRLLLKPVLGRYPTLKFSVTQETDDKGLPKWGRVILIYSRRAEEEYYANGKSKYIDIEIEQASSDPTVQGNGKRYRLFVREATKIRLRPIGSTERCSPILEERTTHEVGQILPLLEQLLDTQKVKNLLAVHNAAGAEEGVERFLSQDLAGLFSLLRKKTPWSITLKSANGKELFSFGMTDRRAGRAHLPASFLRSYIKDTPSLSDRRFNVTVHFRGRRRYLAEVVVQGAAGAEEDAVSSGEQRSTAIRQLHDLSLRIVRKWKDSEPERRILVADQMVSLKEAEKILSENPTSALLGPRSHYGTSLSLPPLGSGITLVDDLTNEELTEQLRIFEGKIYAAGAEEGPSRVFYDLVKVEKFFKNLANIVVFGGSEQPANFQEALQSHVAHPPGLMESGLTAGKVAYLLTSGWEVPNQLTDGQKTLLVWAPLVLEVMHARQVKHQPWVGGPLVEEFLRLKGEVSYREGWPLEDYHQQLISYRWEPTGEACRGFIDRAITIFTPSTGLEESLQQANGLLVLDGEMARALSDVPDAQGGMLIAPEAGVPDRIPTVFADDNMKHLEAEAILPWLKVGPTAEKVIQALPDGIRPGDLVVLEREEGLTPDRVKQWMVQHLGRTDSLPRALIADSNEFGTIPVVALRSIADPSNETIPEVVILHVPDQLQMESGQTADLIVWG